MFLVKRIPIYCVLVAFIVSLSVAPLQAGQIVIPLMPKPGSMVPLSPSFSPALLKGIVIHPDNALKFDFLVDHGEGALNLQEKNQEYNKLIKYFLASLTIPDQNQWVNLSPYEKERVIEDNFGKTEMGRDLLAQDYLLKQITSSLMYPESGLGKEFWNKVYARSQQEYGATNIPVNTFNKVWIVPDQATIYESGNTAYVTKSHLKVMLDEDYLARQSNSTVETRFIASQTTNRTTQDIIRQIILPELEREVNEGKNFANLRQIFSAMLLATWYKKSLKESLLGKIYTDKAKVQGVDVMSSLPNRQTGSKSTILDPERIYAQYLEAFKKGVFSYIKDTEMPSGKSIPRKYFAGGVQHNYATLTQVVKVNPQQLNQAMSIAMPKLDQASVALDQRINIDAAMSKNEIEFKSFVEFKRSGLLDSLVDALSIGGFYDPLTQDLETQIRVHYYKFEYVLNDNTAGFNDLMNVMRPFSFWEDFYKSKDLKELHDRYPKVIDALFPLGGTEQQEERFQYNFQFAQTVLDVIEDANAAMAIDNVVRFKLVSSTESDNFIFESFESFERELQKTRTIKMLRLDGHDQESIAQYKNYFKAAYDADREGFHLFMRLVHDSNTPQDRGYLQGMENLVGKGKGLAEGRNNVEKSHRKLLELLFSDVSTDEGFDNIFWFAKEVITWRNAAMRAEDIDFKDFINFKKIALSVEFHDALKNKGFRVSDMDILRIGIKVHLKQIEFAHKMDRQGFTELLRIIRSAKDHEDDYFKSNLKRLQEEGSFAVTYLFPLNIKEQDVEYRFRSNFDLIKSVLDVKNNQLGKDGAMVGSKRAFLLGGMAIFFSRFVQSSVDPNIRTIPDVTTTISIGDVGKIMKTLKDMVDVLVKKEYLFSLDGDFEKAIEHWERINSEVAESIETIDEFYSETRIDEENFDVNILWLEELLKSLRVSLIKSLNNIFEQELQRLDVELLKFSKMKHVKGIRAINGRLDKIMAEYGGYFPDKKVRIDDFKEDIRRRLKVLRADRAMIGDLVQRIRSFIAELSSDQSTRIPAGNNLFWAKRYLLKQKFSKTEISKHLQVIDALIKNYMLGRVVGVETSEEFVSRLKQLMDQFNKEEFIYYMPQIKEMAIRSEIKSKELIILIYRLKRAMPNEKFFKVYWSDEFVPRVQKVHKNVNKLDQGYKKLNAYIQWVEHKFGVHNPEIPVPQLQSTSGFGAKIDTDFAMVDLQQSQVTDLGGIDFNAAHVDIEIKKDGNGVPLPLAQQDLSQLAFIDGFIPRIIEIKPVSSLPQFQVK